MPGLGLELSANRPPWAPYLQPNLSAPHNIEGYATSSGADSSTRRAAPHAFVERALADLPTRRLNLTAYLDSYAEFAVAWRYALGPGELPDEPVARPQINTELLAKYARRWASCP